MKARTPPALWKHHRKILIPGVDGAALRRLIFVEQCRKLSRDTGVPLKRVMRFGLELQRKESPTSTQ